MARKKSCPEIPTSQLGFFITASEREEPRKGVMKFSQSLVAFSKPKINWSENWVSPTMAAPPAPQAKNSIIFLTREKLLAMAETTK